jgi:hypothetical protein
MEEYQARKQPSQDYQISYNLAHQPYSEPDDMPLEEDMNVVQLPAKPRTASTPGTFDRIAEEPLAPRSPTKRKSSGASKGRGNAGKKSTKTYRSPQPTKQPFADELQHLEELAERINHILAERARQKVYEQSQSQSMRGIAPNAPIATPYPRSPRPQQPIYEQPSLEELDTENLKLQAKRIRHRLSQLELMMDGEEPATHNLHDVGTSYAAHHYSPPPQPPAVPLSAPYQQAYPPQQNPFDSARQRSEYEAWRAAEELRQLKEQERHHYAAAERPDRPNPYSSFEPIVQRAVSRLRRLPIGQFLHLPRKPMDGLSDAVMWVAVAAIARIASRYLIAALPWLSPVVTLLMLAPAGVAIFLAVFMPKTGWIPFYRLFLIMLGLFIGGKFF